MATHDYVIDNSTGANVRADINLVLQAILTNNSSSSAPSTTAAYMWWADTTNGVLKIRNSSNNDWVELLQLDGTLTLEDGSASTPGLAFRDDLNTGIFSSAADTFNVATAGVERMELGTTTIFNEDGADVDFRIEGDTDENLFRVDAGNNRVGIGTGTPSNLLHVAGVLECSNIKILGTNSFESSANVFEGKGSKGARLRSALSAADTPSFSSTDDTNTGFFLPGSDVIGFTTGGNERMRITSDGDVSVGGTSPSSQSAKFQTRGTSQDATRINMHHVGNSSASISASGGLAFGSDTANGTTQRMVLDTSGRVGIGTSDFSNTNSFMDDLVVENTAQGSGAGISIIANATNGYSSIALGDTADKDVGRLQYNHSSNQLDFHTNGDGSKLTIDSSGNVGIGTTSPSTNLHVKGPDGSAPKITLSEGTPESAIRSTASGTSSDLRLMTSVSGTQTTKLIVDYSGNVGIGTTSPTSTGIQSGVKTVQIDSGDGAELILGNSTSQNVSVNHIGAIAFKNIDTSTGNAPHYAGIRSNCADSSGNMNLKFYAGSTDFEADTPHMVIDPNGKVLAGDECTSNRTSYRHQLSSTAGSGDVLSLQNPSSTDGQGIGLGFWARNTNNAAIEVAKLKAVIDETAANSTQKGSLRFLTNVGGSMGERGRFHSGGEFMVGKSSDSNAAAGFMIDDTGKRVNVHRSDSNSHVFLNKIGVGTTGTMMTFAIAASTKGSISVSTTGTTYAATSDYRLKENVVSISDGITKLKQLLPKRFNFIADETNTLCDGFLAHEVSSIVPNAVTGEKDAVDNEGNIDPQQLDYSKIVPLLVAAVQELITKVETLEAA